MSTYIQNTSFSAQTQIVSSVTARHSNHTPIPPNLPSEVGRAIGKGSRTRRERQQLSLFAPLYEATPYWDLEPVPVDESLPEQRYRLVLVHGNLRKAIGVQLHPDEGDRLFGAVRELDYDWSLDLDKTAQLCNFEARSALACLFGAVMGGEGNV